MVSYDFLLRECSVNCDIDQGGEIQVICVSLGLLMGVGVSGHMIAEEGWHCCPMSTLSWRNLISTTVRSGEEQQQRFSLYQMGILLVSIHLPRQRAYHAECGCMMPNCTCLYPPTVRAKKTPFIDGREKNGHSRGLVVEINDAAVLASRQFTEFTARDRARTQSPNSGDWREGGGWLQGTT